MVLALLAMSWNAFGATLEVGPGKAFTTVQSAINVANGGDVIRIYPGTYNESLYIANFDSNGDHDYDDAGDKDYSGLTITGSTGNRDDVVIEPYAGGVPPLNSIRYPGTGVYTFDPFTWDNSFQQYAGIMVDSQRLWNGNASTYKSQLFPDADSHSSLPAAYFTFKGHAAAAGTTSPATLDGITIKDLSFKNCHVGVGLRGNITNAVVSNTKIENAFDGIATYGVRGLRIENNLLRNWKYGMYIGYGTQDADIVDNNLTLTDANPQAFEMHGSDHRAIRVLNHDANSNFGKADLNALKNVNLRRNTINALNYTGSRHIIGIELSGGDSVNVTENNIFGVVKAFWIYYVSWFGTTTNYDINGNTIREYLNGLDMSPYVGQTITRNSFTDFQSNATVPWTEESVFGTTVLHAAPDPARANQNLARTFTVPAAGTTTVSFEHWFSQNGHMFLEIKDNSGNWTPLKRSLYDEDSASVVRQYWGSPFGADDSRRHGYEPDCSGWYTPNVQIPSANTGKFFDAPYNGLTSNGILSESIDLSAYAGQTVTLRFRQFGATYGEKGAFGCTINGVSDFAGWYVRNFKVENSGSGVVNDANDNPLDETSGAVVSNWVNDTDTPSYAIQLGNKDRTHSGALLGTGAFTVSQNTISNPNGDGIVIRHDTKPEVLQKVEINGNDFVNNGRYAVNIFNAADVTKTIDAEDNWWGSNNGPVVAPTSPATGQQVINDPNGVVDYTPFTRSLTADSIQAAAFGSGVAPRSNCSGAGYSIIFYGYDGTSNPPVLGTLGCNGTFTAGSTLGGPAPVLIRFQSTNPVDMPDFQVGDFITFTAGGETYRVYLRPNSNSTNFYGNSIYFWPSSDGASYFAGRSTNRNAGPGSSNFQGFQDARNGTYNGGKGDFAITVGSITYPITFTASSDFNWIGLPHFRSDINKAQQLYTALNNQYTAEGGSGTLVRTIARWNNASQTFTQFIAVPFVSGNFDLALGDAYRVESNNRNHVWSFQGAEPNVNTVAYLLRKTQSAGTNYLSLPWYKSNLVFASELFADVNNNNSLGTPIANSIQVWNAVSQTFTEYTPLNGAVITISQGQAFRVDVSATATYTPLQ